MIRIMQYCDGVLPPHEAAAVAEEIGRDPEAARFAAEFSAGAAAARLAWADLESGPVPFDLARRVKQAAKAPPARKAPAFGAIDLRLAATLLIGLVLGALGVALFQQGSGEGLRLAGSEDTGGPAWKPALMSALAKDPQTAPIAFDGAAHAVRIARWFDTATGQRCAEFVTTTGAAATGGVACRKADGAWDVIEEQP